MPNLTNFSYLQPNRTNFETCLLQTYLDAFAEAAQSPYGCLLVAGKVAVATRKWWELSALELVLLPLLLNELTASASRDVAVFLPVTSPKVRDNMALYFFLFKGEQLL